MFETNAQYAKGYEADSFAANEREHPPADTRQTSAGIVGRSRALRTVLHEVEQVADTDATVLVGGESGTGKELALETCGWRVSGENGAARLLQINPSTLASRLKALGLHKPHDASDETQPARALDYGHATVARPATEAHYA
jgi:transcriptional regulator with GAF, ATPase, and Fis domain